MSSKAMSRFADDDSLEWPVWGAGHNWITAKDPRDVSDAEPGPMLVDANPDKPSMPTWYRPTIDQPALFRILADTPATRDGVRHFADTYGLLGGAFGVRVTLECGGSSLYAEPLLDWLNAICDMREVLFLWDLVSAGDVAALADVITWKGNLIHFCPKDTLYFPEWRGSPGDAVLPRNPPWFEGLNVLGARGQNLVQSRSAPESGPRGSDYLFAAMALIRSLVNHYLFSECPGTSAAHCQLMFDRKTGYLTLSPVPQHLGGAIWLQAAEAIARRKRFRTCRECGRWYELPSRGARITREYCGVPCRLRAYRGRQDKARDLHRQGKSAKEIAAELKTDTKTIKTWLKAKG
jgi:hypothetical protein